MKKTILIIQMVLVSFLFSNSIHAQSKLDAAIIGLKSEDVRVRYSTVNALGELKDKRAVIPLVAALNDQNNCVRRKSVLVVGKLNDNT